MLLRVAEFRGSRVLALDGILGKVRDIYFDDAHWAVRDLVIDTGRWLQTRRVLIAPRQVELIDPATHAVMLSVPRDTIQVSPPADSHRPVSQQLGAARHRAIEAREDAHLRSASEVSKYCIGAVDGWAGRVADFLLDDETWSLRYLVVELGIWPFTNQVMLAREHVQEINWGAQCVGVDMTRVQVRGATRFDPEALPPRAAVTARAGAASADPASSPG